MIYKNFMGRTFFGLFSLISSFLFVSPSFAAVLHWSPVESTADCIIAGYKVHYGNTYGMYSSVIDVGELTFCDLDSLSLVPSRTYYFAVNAYSTTHHEGPLSSPVSYTTPLDQPIIVEYPVIDHANNTIDVSFNESDMQGAGIKENYEFSPTIPFNFAHQIIRTDKTYRLFMTYIPEHTIITMTLTNVLNDNGLALVSDSIVINDDDKDNMADDWETHYGISTALLDKDSDGLNNRLEYTAGTSPIDADSDDDGMDDAWEVQNGLNPVLNDAAGDADGDGLSNLVEYNEGTPVSNRGPEKPVLNLPDNASINVSLRPLLRTRSYVDHENDAHSKTQWQISTEQNFTLPENILFDQEANDYLTVLMVPGSTLDEGKTYYWRVRFFDSLNGRSQWSDPSSFTTLTLYPEEPEEKNPNIVEYPVIDHANNTIDVSFNESDMQGAGIKENYEFSPTIPFSSAHEIVRTDKTYRLFMTYIPEHTIITMTLTNVLNDNGLALVSDSIVINDDDKDNMADDWETHYGISTAFLDTDSDGLNNRLEYTTGTSPIDADSDDDGMDDAWEVQNGSNPVLNDAAGDADGDGISNLVEYNEGTPVSNRGPEKPVLNLPDNASINVSLRPLLRTRSYVDHENDAHSKTQWQISTEQNFTLPEDILFDIETDGYLTSLMVPESTLDEGKTYYWRVRFFDSLNGRSQWSDPSSFTTLTLYPEEPEEKNPNIVEYPVIDHANNTIDVSFNESDMQGAGIKENYEFSPTIPFSSAHEIVRTDKTYRLFMTYIPEHTIITMTLTNVLNGNGLALVSDSIVINDDDKDNMADDWETHYGISTAFLDTDSDGLNNRLEYTTGTSPIDADSDDDGMDDAWEVQNGSNPVLNDAAGDADGDGISNLVEYNEGTPVSNRGPEKPVLNLPDNASINVSLRPLLRTRSYVDHENDAHSKTQWQISTEQNFTLPEDILFDIETDGYLTSLMVPESTLDEGKTYYWRVRFFDSLNGRSQWSDPSSFTTLTLYPEEPEEKNPNIVEYPVIDHANNTIDVSFNESDMQGAGIKENYEFSPTIPFSSAHEIVRTDKTYRLFMTYIPEHTIITMTLTNVLNDNGLALVSDSIVINDDDKDNMADDWETHYGISTAFLDTDSDGLNNRLEYTTGTSPIDADSDDDGMDDAWEVQNGSNPVLNDAAGDADGDGISNLVEYNEGTPVSNRGPEKPVLNLPDNASINVSLRPLLRTRSYVDHENDAHSKTQWQIGTEQSFTLPEDILFDLETYDCLTSLVIPEFILDPGKTYYWRARFFDVPNNRSPWSDPSSFTTMTLNPEDPDGNGIPDIQQINDVTIDLNNDGSLDTASNTYKMLTNGNTSFSLEASDNTSTIDCLKSIDPNDIPDTFGRPDNLEFGLLHFKLRVSNPGDAAQIRIYFSEPVGAEWYKYDLINGWREYSRDYPGNVQFDSDRKSVLLRLVDGGPGDSDGVANSIIVDPSGPGGVVSASSTNSSSSTGGASSGGGGGGGCFIATAAFGSPMEKHVQILKDFRDIYLLKSRLGTAFVKAYYRYSPPVADVIARHSVLRVVVRIGLMPLIGFSYVIIYTSLFQQSLIFLLLIGIATMIYKNVKLQYKIRLQSSIHCHEKNMG